MDLYNKDGEKTSRITREERLKILLFNAIFLFAEAHADRYNTNSEFIENLFDYIGTDAKEMEELGIDLSDIL